MSDIVLSSGVRSNLLQLQQTSDLITSTQTKLATGKRVNSALDNPINFFTAQGLTVRANDLNALLDTMTTGINTIQAANNLSLIHISEPTRRTPISYAVFCLKKKKKTKPNTKKT